MARTTAIKATEVKAKTIKDVAKEVAKAETVVTATLYALPITSEAKATHLAHVWKKVIGKYHRKGRPTICPGDTFIASEGAFKNDPTWEYVGPVE